MATDTKKASDKKQAKAELSLQEQLAEAKQSLHDAKKSHRAGELINPRVIGEYRKNIARVKTAISAEKIRESK